MAQSAGSSLMSAVKILLRAVLIRGPRIAQPARSFT